MTDTVLSVQNLCKRYPAFFLDHVSFEIRRGEIMGFIGRNGAGKTTTLKSILNLAHPDGGEVAFFGLPFKDNENAIKQRIGYMGGAVNYYKKKKIQTILDVTKRFYENWSDDACRHYFDVFHLDPAKTPDELSEGMKVKFSLSLALSHQAELLNLDEPTSGLDPVSRAELLDIFEQLSAKGIAILYSTHITSDLDKCADRITYIKTGQILFSDKKEAMPCSAEELMIRNEKEVLRV